MRVYASTGTRVDSGRRINGTVVTFKVDMGVHKSFATFGVWTTAQLRPNLLCGQCVCHVTVTRE